MTDLEDWIAWLPQTLGIAQTPSPLGELPLAPSVMVTYDYDLPNSPHDLPPTWQEEYHKYNSLEHGNYREVLPAGLYILTVGPVPMRYGTTQEPLEHSSMLNDEGMPTPIRSME